MKAKSKSKTKSGRKLSRLKFTEKEESPSTDDTIDLSNLRKPIPTSLSSLRQVTKLFDNGSDEVKSILDYECEIIYECRICRSLFRSLANFISHKRVYCRDKYDVTTDRSAINPQSMTCMPTQALSLDAESKENKHQTRSQNSKKIPKKDLTSVVEMLQQRQADEDGNNQSNKPPMRILSDNEQFLMEVIDTNKAAYQTVLGPTNTDFNTCDLMKAQADEIQSILNRDTAVLGPDGQLIEVAHIEKSDSPMQIYDNPDDSLSSNSSGDQNLVCSICDSKFATKKTLTFHTKSLHTKNRTVYPCPCCDSTFTNTWGVYRHLYKIHRKSNEQVRKLRPQIAKKAYIAESTRAQELEKDSEAQKTTAAAAAAAAAAEASTNETAEWMAHLESDGELQRCGGCGKRFDRKAALLSHSQICQKRIAACVDGATRAKRAKVTSDIVAETSTLSPITNRVPVNETSISVKDIIPKVMRKEAETAKENGRGRMLRLANISPAVTITRLANEPQINIRVEDVGSMTRDAWEKIGEGNEEAAELEKIEPRIQIKEELEIVRIKQEKMDDEKIAGEKEANGEKSMQQDDDPEIIFTKIEKNKNVTVTKKRKLGKPDGPKVAQSILIKRSKTPSLKERPDSPEPPRPISNRVKAIERRIATIADLKLLRCLPCSKKFSSMANLRRHMAIHINWNRYCCKVCGFKCFEKVDCVAHCNMAHDAKNSRTVLAGMMIEIQPDENSIARAGRSLLKKSQPEGAVDLEVIDVTKPKTTSDDIANANEEIDCIQNGDLHIRSFDDDDEPEDNPDDPSDIGRNVKLNEDPELRRMVMEVIFGTSDDCSLSEQSSSSSANTPPKLTREVSLERSTSSSPSSLDTPPKVKIESPKNEDRNQRPTRNRSKVIDKDFIYDLDAVILPKQVVSKVTTHNNDGTNGVNSKSSKKTAPPAEVNNVKSTNDLTALVVVSGDNKSDSDAHDDSKTNNVAICEK